MTLATFKYSDAVNKYSRPGGGSSSSNWAQVEVHEPVSTIVVSEPTQYYFGYWALRASDFTHDGVLDLAGECGASIGLGRGLTLRKPFRSSVDVFARSLARNKASSSGPSGIERATSGQPSVTPSQRCVIASQTRLFR
jgi:hypothetical protein